MKNISTAATKQARNIQEQKLTIGLHLGDRWSWYCVLDSTGDVLLEQKTEHHREGPERSVQSDATESDCIGNGDAFSVGESVIERVGTRSHRGACPQRALDRGE